MKNMGSRDSSQPTRPKPWVGIHSGVDHTTQPALLPVISTIRWDDWKGGRNMWLLLGEKTLRRGYLLRENSQVPFSIPATATPSRYFSLLSHVPYGIIYHFFWHVCFLPRESKAPWRQGYLSVLLTDGFISTWYRVGSVNGRHASMCWALWGQL